MAFEWNINLLLFDGAGAGAAPAAGGESGGEAAAVTTGTAEDGTVIDNRLAARMEKQAQKRKARGEMAMPAPGIKPAAAAEQRTAEEPQESADDRWQKLKKGEFKEQYGRDIQAAISERFKNQQDANDQLKAMQPMLQALMQKAGVESVDELSKIVLDDDSLYEEEAEQRGMTVSALKYTKQLEAQANELKAREAEALEQQQLRQHFDGLARQAEELKKTFPDFDLMTEMENETFRRLTAPNSGLKLEDAYYAVHHNELAPQAMAYGIDRAKRQISQNLQANGRRPTEGAAQGGQPANFAIDVRSMTRAQREQIKQRVRRGERIEF
jgi:hypothetical protein